MVEAGSTATVDDAPSLEPHHNHVVLVPGSRWGVEAGRPVLVVADSGRAADTMVAALQDNSQDKRAAELAASWPVQAVDLGAGPHTLARAVAGVLTTRPQPRLLSKAYEELLKADFNGLIGELQLKLALKLGADYAIDANRSTSLLAGISCKQANAPGRGGW